MNIWLLKARSWLFVILSFFALTLALPAALADNANPPPKLSYSISPLVFDGLVANPGDKLVNTLRVSNLNSAPLPIEMQVESFTGNETGQATVTDQGDPTYSLTSWVTFSPKNFTLASGQTKDVTFTINVPQDAEPGGRYGSLLASTQKASVEGTGIATVNKIGSLVLLKINGSITYQATVTSFQPTRNLFEQAPVTFTARIHNDSTVHIKPKGFVTISNMFGHKVIDLAVADHNALPKSDRLYSAKDLVWKGPAGIGRYSATLLLTYGDKGDQITATASFWVFPWKIGLPLIAVGIIVIWFIIARRRNLAVATKILFAKK